MDKCKIGNCDKPVRANGYCVNHYNQKRYATIKKRCIIIGCESKATRKGYCQKHNAINISMLKDNRCIVDLCEEYVYQKKMCHKHFINNKHYGSPNGEGICKRLKWTNAYYTYGLITYIKLYQGGELKTIVCFDTKHLEVVKTWKWALSTKGYVRGSKKGEKVKRFHHLILNFTYDPNIDLISDHIDGNKSNNLEVNLRLVTFKVNSNNRGLSKNNKLGQKGIDFKKDCNKYRATIQSNGKSIVLYLGDSLDEAIEARKKGELKYFGELSHHYKEHKRTEEETQLEFNFKGEEDDIR